MFNKFKWWTIKSNKDTEKTIQEQPDDILPTPEELEFCISYMLGKDEQIYIDVSTSNSEYSSHDLAALLNYISSLQGQLDTMEVLKKGMDPKDHESFLGHFLTLKTKEAEMISSTTEKSKTDEQSPCISPLDML